MFKVEPIGFVHSPRMAVVDDFWGDVPATIELVAEMPAEGLDGLEEFSHAEIVFLMDRVLPKKIIRGTRHQRNNTKLPKTGIFSQRAKSRPNRLGCTIVRIIGREGRTLRVMGLDALDKSPVLDIKPVLAEFLPREPVRQPAWTHDLMRDYWRPDAERPAAAP